MKKIFAVCLIVKDFKKSMDFYTNIMGFEVNSKDGVFADFKLGETSLAIFEKSGATSMLSEKYMNVGGGAVIAFQTKNLNMYVDDVKKKGGNIVEGPKTTEWGQKVVYFLDPDGNIIEVSEE